MRGHDVGRRRGDPAALIATIMGAVAARADELGVPAPVLRPA